MLSIVRQSSVFVLLTLWASLMTFICVALMIGHWVQLPRPAIGTFQELDSASVSSVTRRWKALHFLYSECQCSRRILKHLLEREPIQDIEEVIVLVGEPEPNREQLQKSKFNFEFLTPEELTRKYNVEAAPLLLVLSPDRAIRYSGGYTSRKQGLVMQDLSLIRKTIAGETIPPLPVYGCGVSESIKALTDPLGLKRITKSN